MAVFLPGGPLSRNAVFRSELRPVTNCTGEVAILLTGAVAIHGHRNIHSSRSSARSSS
jgi:hypothetical protein